MRRKLDKKIYTVNRWLEGDGFSVRLVSNGRNGYIAIDEYPVWPDGTRRGSCVNRTVCYGSAEKCAIAAERYYGELYRRAQIEGVI